MKIPTEIREVLADCLSKQGNMEVQGAARGLSLRYNEKKAGNDGNSLLRGDMDVLAYALTRMPATYAAVNRALALSLPLIDGEISSVLDVGAGPGTASLAALSLLSPKRIALVERDTGMAALAREIFDRSGIFGGELSFDMRDMKAADLPKSDLVMAAYCLLELNEKDCLEMVDRLFEATQKLLLIVEPGTPDGHRRLCVWRDRVYGMGGYMVSPCPGQIACPLKGDDWCAFNVRVERTAAHKRLKGASAPFEDEKFSFMAFSKVRPEGLPPMRIRRYPRTQKGFVELPVCREGGTDLLRIAKSMDGYKRARKAEYGDPWE